MSHHETPQKRERLQKLQNLHSPLTLPISTPPIDFPLWQQAPKRRLSLRRRGRIRRRSGDDLRRSHREAGSVVVVVLLAEKRPSRRVEPGAGGGHVGGAVVVPAPEVGVGVDAGAVVASGAGGTVSEASAAEICSVIARR
jgi:hypothetical protein